MRVLVVAPDQDLNTIPEVRQIQRQHHMSVLHGVVTPADLYQCARDTAFQGIHYAAHSGPEGVHLSNGVILTPEDVAQVARLKHTKLLFFNSCLSGALASYAVRHGVRYAIHSNINLPDADAWKLPMAFYESLQNGHSDDIVAAFRNADSGDGDYGLQVDPDYLGRLEEATTAAANVAGSRSLTITTRQAVMMGLGLLTASGLLTLLINALAGRM